MSLPIVQLILIRGYTEAYYQLSDEEQEKLWTQVYNVITASGAKAIGPKYNTRWSNDTYAEFFMLEHPTIEAAIAYTSGIEQLELFRYVDRQSILGIASPA